MSSPLPDYLLKPIAVHCCRDEQNLEENERIKKELNPRKIGALCS